MDIKLLSPLGQRLIASQGGNRHLARRKFFDLHAYNQSQLAQQTLVYIQKLYQVEREVAELNSEERQRIRREQAQPILDEFHDWLARHRLQVPN